MYKNRYSKTAIQKPRKNSDAQKSRQAKTRDEQKQRHTQSTTNKLVAQYRDRAEAAKQKGATGKYSDDRHRDS